MMFLFCVTFNTYSHSFPFWPAADGLRIRLSYTVRLLEYQKEYSKYYSCVKLKALGIPVKEPRVWPLCTWFLSVDGV